MSRSVDEPRRKILQLLLTGLVSPRPKVRWNAATALGNSLSSLGVLADVEAMKCVLQGLQESITGDRNLKVRIQAVKSLATPARAAQLGGGVAVQVLVDKLESVRDCVRKAQVESKEIAHQLQLIQQLDSGILHLISLATAETVKVTP